jgi:hypothetical protein
LTLTPSQASPEHRCGAAHAAGARALPKAADPDAGRPMRLCRRQPSTGTRGSTPDSSCGLVGPMAPLPGHHSVSIGRGHLTEPRGLRTRRQPAGAIIITGVSVAAGVHWTRHKRARHVLITDWQFLDQSAHNPWISRRRHQNFVYRLYASAPSPHDRVANAGRGIDCPSANPVSAPSWSVSTAGPVRTSTCAGRAISLAIVAHPRNGAPAFAVATSIWALRETSVTRTEATRSAWRCARHGQRSLPRRARRP